MALLSEVRSLAELSRKMEDAAMIWSSRSARPAFPNRLNRLLTLAAVSLLALFAARTSTVVAQVGEQTGSIGGRVVDDQGTALAGAVVAIQGTQIATQTRANGEYVLPPVPAGTRSLQSRLLGYRPESSSVSVTVGPPRTQESASRRYPVR